MIVMINSEGGEPDFKALLITIAIVLGFLFMLFAIIL